MPSIPVDRRSFLAGAAAASAVLGRSGLARNVWYEGHRAAVTGILNECDVIVSTIDTLSERIGRWMSWFN